MKSILFRNITVYFLFLALFYLSPTTSLAQVPDPYVPCDQTRNTEFHSLRPYQASPCNEEVADIALFCGNDILIPDSFTVTKNFDPDSYVYEGTNLSPDCTPNSDGTMETCSFSIDRQKEIVIDVDDAYLPIMGNTEGVVNSQDQPDPEPIDDPAKVNEYVSWYLNGINERAEYPFLDPVNDERKIIDFSGPLKKLLAFDSQHRVRIEEVERAADDRHDQVVGCTSILGGIIPCPDGGTERRLSFWEDRLPPLPEDYDTFIQYWVDYLVWRGRSCVYVNLPIIGEQYICVDNPLRPNYIGSLFQYIPFSSTEDRKGEVEVQTVDVQQVSPTLRLTNVVFANQQPAELFFAHMEESVELADLLQQTFTPDGENRDAPADTSILEVPPYCDVHEVRSNPGDDLFAGEIRGDLTYTANFTCDFQIYDPGDSEEPPIGTACAALGYTCYPNDWGNCTAEAEPLTEGCHNGYYCALDCDSQPPEPEDCDLDLNVRLSTLTKTPLADEVWSKTVAGPGSVFRRWLPKIDEDGPIQALLDIPAASPVTFRDLVNGTNLQVVNPAIPSRPPELYFPHIGGIHQYFLKCMQTLLRPQGYGESCPSGVPNPDTIPSSDTCPEVPDSQVDAKWLGNMKTNFIRLADGWGGAECNMAEECYNYVVTESESSGVNPALSLTVWLNESGASNYCAYPGVQDFGWNVAGTEENIVFQLESFLGLPSAATYLDCRSQPGFAEPMHAFFARMKAGGCDPSETTTYCNRINTWKWVVEPLGSCTDFTQPDVCGNGGEGFSITWPTDSSCP